MAMRVAVIGAGAAGLCALQHLSAHKSFKVMGFEQSRRVGGTWVYTERIGTDEDGLPVHSSMYANLKTNLPKEVMAFPDFPFPSEGESFISHQEVLQYLEEYCQHFKLDQFIKFSTCVEKVEPSLQNNKTVWNLWSRPIACQEMEQHQFDAVVVCNGHYSTPLAPDIPGSDQFKGEMIHSHNYRHPENYAGKKVVLLGAAASGQDIALDVAPYASEVVICHRKELLKSPLPSNVHQAKGIKELKESSIVLEDGEIIENADVLMFCTGYKYVFPFLAPSCHPHIEDERVPLYKHIVHPSYPTLSFMGIPKTICPFPAFDRQIRFIIAGLTEAKPFPSKEDMEADIEADFQGRLSRGMPPRYAHHLGSLQWDYFNDLANLGGFEPLPLFIEKLYDSVHNERHNSLQTYKCHRFKITGPDSFLAV